MTLEAGKEMDRRCVLNWLNEVYVTPSRAFDEYTEDELRMFAHDAIAMLEEKEPQSVIFDRQCEVEPGHWERKGFCPKCHQVVLWIVNREYCGFCGQEVKWDA